MSFSKIQDIIKNSDERGLPFWQIILEDDLQERNTTYEESFRRMQSMFEAMVQADKDYSADLRSQSGLSGGDGAKLEKFRQQNNRLIGDFLTMVMEKAVK
nr:hypothetical protein [Treponema sp.]